MRNEETMCEGLLSVVIPVYNIRDYVERCVRSVLAQPDVPLEVLIVDDGSTDDSGAVCDALAAEDSRVTVIHKPNGGLSDARNYGLCHAQGEYILFMDGDDWLAENVCPGLLQMALQDRADVVIGKVHFLREEPVMTRWEEAVEKNFTFHTVYTGKEYLLKCLQTGGLRVEVGRHLYRTGFLRANGLQFCKGILHEDEEFTPRVLLQAQRVVLTGQEIYYYDNCRAGSITHAEGLSTRRVQHGYGRRCASRRYEPLCGTCPCRTPAATTTASNWRCSKPGCARWSLPCPAGTTAAEKTKQQKRPCAPDGFRAQGRCIL